jgi:hypothetical protein
MARDAGRPSTEDLHRALVVFRDLFAAAAAAVADASSVGSVSSVLTCDAEALRRLGYTRRVLEDAARTGDLHGVKVARGWRIALPDLEAWELSRGTRRRGGRAGASAGSMAARPCAPAVGGADDDATADDLALLRASGARPTRR